MDSEKVISFLSNIQLYAFQQYFWVCLEVGLSHYEPNPEWKLLSATSTRHFQTFRDNTTFPWIEYSFVMQRHSRMYEATVGVPVLGKQSTDLLESTVN